MKNIILSFLFVFLLSGTMYGQSVYNKIDKIYVYVKYESNPILTDTIYYYLDTNYGIVQCTKQIYDKIVLRKINICYCIFDDKDNLLKILSIYIQ